MKTLAEVKAGYLTRAKSKALADQVVTDRNGKVVASSAKPFQHIYTSAEDVEWAKAQGKKYKEETMDDGRKLLFFSSWARPTPMLQSLNGQYYEEANLPEQSDAFVTERYAVEVRAERDARLSDTDKYVQLSDVTVKGSAGKARTALTDDQKTAVLKYREELRDMPATEGFPFVDYPVAPDCILYEVSQAIERREAQRSFYA